MSWYTKYSAYLRSTAWKLKRTEAIGHYGSFCSICKKNGILHVHHKSYKNLFNEPMEDLQILCEPCHRDLHGMKPLKNKNSRMKRKLKRKLVPVWDKRRKEMVFV